MNKRLYMRRWLLALDRYELRLRVPVARERNRFIKAVSAEFERTGDNIIPQHILKAHRDSLSAILLAHYQSVIPYFGTAATQGFKSKHRYIEHKAKRSAFYGKLQEWASTRALANARSIADTDIDDVRGAIQSGLDSGSGISEIASVIRQVTDLTVHRARTVARTETHAAATYGAIEEARQTSEEIGIRLVKEWLPTLDARTRPEHAAMASAGAIPLDQEFNVGGEYLDRPGDPSGSPENVINCRCAIITEEAPE